MASIKEPFLDLSLMDLNSTKLLGIIDISAYPTNWNKVSPTLEITIPGFNTVFLPFVPSSLQVINSNHLGITCDDDCLKALPDGIYTLRYSIYPAYKYYVDKTFLRVEQLYEKFDKLFLTLELQCVSPSSTQRKQMEEIELYIQGAMAAASNCAIKLATELYNKADNLLTGLIKTNG